MSAFEEKEISDPIEKEIFDLIEKEISDLRESFATVFSISTSQDTLNTPSRHLQTSSRHPQTFYGLQGTGRKTIFEHHSLR